MIYSLVLAFSLLAYPQAFLLQSAIDSAKIIGLPRLKTMDRFFAKTICIDEVQGEVAFITFSRKDFLKKYLKLHSLKGANDA